VSRTFFKKSFFSSLRLFNHQAPLPKSLSLKKSIILHIFMFSWHFIMIVYW